jgi:GAF domain-containing protein
MEKKPTTEPGKAAVTQGSQVPSNRSEEALKLVTHQIDDIFLSYPDNKMYDKVLEVVRKATESKISAFGTMDTDGSVVVPSMSKEVWLTCRIPFKTYRFPRSTWTGIWIPALEGKKAHYSNESKPVPMGHVPIKRVMIVPILNQGKVIGHFEMANKATDYTDTDLEFLKKIADHVSPMLYARLEKTLWKD